VVLRLAFRGVASGALQFPNRIQTKPKQSESSHEPLDPLSLIDNRHVSDRSFNLASVSRHVHVSGNPLVGHEIGSRCSRIAQALNVTDNSVAPTASSCGSKTFPTRSTNFELKEIEVFGIYARPLTGILAGLGIVLK
jgi:hypothetical protein